MDFNIINEAFGDCCCRTCLGKSENTISLYAQLNHNNETFIIKDLLESTVNVEVSSNTLSKRFHILNPHLQISFEDELLPKRICYNCTNQLVAAYEFFKQIKYSEEIIKNLKLLNQNDNDNVGLISIENSTADVPISEEDFDYYIEKQTELSELIDTVSNVPASIEEEITEEISNDYFTVLTNEIKQR